MAAPRISRSSSHVAATSCSVAIAMLAATIAGEVLPVWAEAVAMTLACLSVAIALSVVLARRHYPPLAQTCLPLALCAVNASLIVDAYDLLSDHLPPTAHCNIVARWAVNVLSLASVVPYMILGWRLHVIFHAGEAEPRCLPWLYTISDAGLVRIFFVAMSMPFLFTTIQTLTPFLRDATKSIYAPCDQQAETSLVFLLSCNSAALLILGGLYASVRRQCQTFGIHNELGMVTFAQAVFVAVYCIPLFVKVPLNPYRFVSSARAIACFVASVALPLQKSFKSAPPVPIVPRPERALTLAGILSDPLYFTFFNDFVSDDSDCVLLEFFMQAKMFPDERDPAARLCLAISIFNMYLRKESPRSLSRDVDLDSPEIQKIDQLIHSSCSPLPNDLFSKPAADVFHQMEHFTLRRFRLSASYMAMLKEMRRHLLIRERLFFSEMIDERGLRLTVPLLVNDA